MIESLPSHAVAVVGNGPSMLGKGLGVAIDAHDHVVRFNNYQVRGHEQDVGERTTAWATTFLADVMRRPIQRVRCVLPLHDLRFWRRHARHYPLGFDATGMTLHAQDSDYEEIPFDVYARAGRVSAGMLFLFWLYVERGWSLDGVDIYGFAHFDPCVPHHYWTSIGASGEQRAHAPNVEREFLRQMLAKEIR